MMPSVASISASLRLVSSNSHQSTVAVAVADCNRFLVVESRFRTQAISHEVHDCIVENLTPEMEEAPLLLATMLSQGSSERASVKLVT